MTYQNIKIALVIIIVSLLCASRTSFHEQVLRYSKEKIKKLALESVDDQTLFAGALDGMTATLDDRPYSAYIPQKDLFEYENELRGRVAGVGLVRPSKDLIKGELIVCPMFQSPAAQAGLRFGDRIVEIDNIPVASLSMRDIFERLEGEPGTRVAFKIRPRESVINDLKKNFLLDEQQNDNHSDSEVNISKSDISDVKSSDENTSDTIISDAIISETGASDTVSSDINSDKIILDSKKTDLESPAYFDSNQNLPIVEVERSMVQRDMLTGDWRYPNGEWNFTLQTHPEIGYIRLIQFTETTGEEVGKALDQLDEKHIRSLILDLRGNPGGTLTSAVDVCNYFLPEGSEIVTTRFRDGSVKRAYKAASAKNVKKRDMKLAVLIDGDSASASEIVAAALQDHQRAVVMGIRSYGKGTVQELFVLPFRMGMLRLTDASYWRPTGQDIHRRHNAKISDPWGVMPNDGYLLEESNLQLFFSGWIRDLRSMLSPEEANYACSLSADGLAQLVERELILLEKEEHSKSALKIEKNVSALSSSQNEIVQIDGIQKNGIQDEIIQDEANQKDTIQKDIVQDNLVQIEEAQNEIVQDKTDGQKESNRTESEQSREEDLLDFARMLNADGPYYDPLLSKAIQYFSAESQENASNQEEK